MWFKSKTQHADPEVRRKYVEQLPAGDASLLSAALEDPHPDVRCAAVERLDDLEVLQNLSAADSDPQIRARATARLQTILSGSCSDSLPLQQRGEFLAACDDPRLLAYVARSGDEPQLRKQAMHRLLDGDGAAPGLGAVLCDIAADDPVSELREAAAKAIVAEDELATLVQRSRGRDKTVYRLAQKKLERIRARAAARADLERCVAETEALLARDTDAELAAAETRLAALDSDWQAATGVLEDSVDAALRTRYEIARDACAARFGAARALKRRRDEILTALQAHVDGKGNDEVAELSRRWHDLGEPQPSEARQFDRLMHAAHEIDSQRDREEQRAERCQALIDAAAGALEGEELSAGDIASLEAQWRTLPLPEDSAVRQPLQAAFEAAVQKLRGRLERQQGELAREEQRIVALLDRYEEALTGGQLRDALSAHDKAASALGKLEAPAAVRKPLEERLRAFEPRMAELRRWRHWGTARARESLCVRAEELIGSALKPPAVAREVRAIRDEWQKLDKADGAASKPLWERFDAACEKAYAPCEAFFAEQKQQREANMALRVTLCEKLEQIAQQTDWDNPPWRDLANALRDTQREWHRGGPVDRRQKKKIDKRFRAANKAIEVHLDARRQAEIERREALIATVEGIPENADLRDAIRIAKNAQRDWKPLVQADRKTERQLWTRFRTACDAIFERRKSQIEAADQERAHHLAEKKAVCDQIEQLIAQVGQDEQATAPAEARRQLNRLRSGWQRIGPVPRDEQRAIDQRFRGACESLGRLCDEADEREAQAQLEAMREMARRCDAFEHALSAGEELDPVAVEDAIGACAGNRDMAPLAQRLERIGQAAGGDARAREQVVRSLEDNLAQRRQICLEMEVAANIDSPPEYQQERMSWRVNQLSASLSGSRERRDAAALQRAWFETGAVPASEQAALEARFERALQALGRS